VWSGTAGQAVQITHEGLDPAIPALFVRPRPTVERTLYVVSILVIFVVGIAIFFYAQLSPLYLVALTILVAWILIYAKNLGENRSREKLESAYRSFLRALAFIFYL
jgi:heme O synthase-like polyprenyltransferase